MCFFSVLTLFRDMLTTLPRIRTKVLKNTRISLKRSLISDRVIQEQKLQLPMERLRLRSLLKVRLPQLNPVQIPRVTTELSSLILPQELHWKKLNLREKMFSVLPYIFRNPVFLRQPEVSLYLRESKKSVRLLFPSLIHRI